MLNDVDCFTVLPLLAFVKNRSKLASLELERRVLSLLAYVNNRTKTQGCGVGSSHLPGRVELEGGVWLLRPEASGTLVVPPSGGVRL